MENYAHKAGCLQGQDAPKKFKTKKKRAPNATNENGSILNQVN